ncbi:hypothetical protein ACHAXR_013387, partial [Thalassiosira sp. AJA248-18]
KTAGRSSPDHHHHSGGGGGNSNNSSTNNNNNAADVKRIIMSHAKAVVGRAMTSGVLGSLWGLEVLGLGGGGGGNGISSLKKMIDDAEKKGDVDARMEEDDDDDNDHKKENQGDDDVKIPANAKNNEPKEDDSTTITTNPPEHYSILRKCLWSGLMALETSFQLNPRPKLLMTSGITSPTSTTAMTTATTTTTTSFGGGGGSSGGGGYRSTTTAHGGGGGTIGGLTDFDHLLSTAMMGGSTGGGVSGNGGGGIGGNGVGTTSSSRSLSSVGSHAHLMMGADTISMWNGLLQRLLVDYKVEFHYLADITAMVPPPPQEGRALLKGENDYLARICYEVTQAVFGNEDDTTLIHHVLDSAATGGGGGGADTNKDATLSHSSSQPPAKKARRGTTSTTTKRKAATTTTTSKKKKPTTTTHHPPPQEYDYSQLSALLSQRMENHVTFDCHVSIRRWAVLAFGWLCQGQKRLLETGTEMLMNGGAWERIMELPAVVVDDAAAAAGGGEGSGRGSKKKVATTSTKQQQQQQQQQHYESSEKEALPGNLALIIFVSCMIDMIYDAGATGGLSPPSSGWMDDYVKAVIGGLAVVPPVVPLTLPPSKEEVKMEEEKLLATEKKEPDDSKPAAAVEQPAGTAGAAASLSAAAPSETTGGAPVRRSSRKRSKTTKGTQNDRATKAAAAAATATKASRSHTPPHRGGGGGSGSPSKSQGGGRRGSPGGGGGGNSGGGHGGGGGGGGNKIWIRPDVRNETAVLTKVLMQAHVGCLHDNVVVVGGTKKKQQTTVKAPPPPGGFVLLNDDETFHSSNTASPSSSSSKRRSAGSSSAGKVSSSNNNNANNNSMKYYPFMHRTLETLGRTAASSSFFASSDGKAKIVTIGSGVALRCFLERYECYCNNNNGGNTSVSSNNSSPEDGSSGATVVVLDAKLMSLAVSQFSECLEGILLNAMTMTSMMSASNSSSAAATSSAAASSSNTSCAIPENIVSTCHLNDPLDITPDNAKRAVLLAARAAAEDSSKGNTGFASSSGGGGNTSFSAYGGAFTKMPQETKKKKSDAAASSSSATTTGGVRSFRNSAAHHSSSNNSNSTNSNNSVEILSLFVRAQLSKDDTSPSPTKIMGDSPPPYHQAMTSLLKSLLGIIRVCYEFGPESATSSSSSQGLENESSTTSSSKKKSKKKKRKASEFTTSVLESGVGVGSVGGKEVLPRKTLTRCILASDAINALIQSLVCVTNNHNHNHTTSTETSSWMTTTTTSPCPLPSSSNHDSSSILSTSLTIRSYFRQCLSSSTDLIVDYVKLGYLLEEKLTRPRLALVSRDYSALVEEYNNTSSSAASLGGYANAVQRDKAYMMANMIEVFNVFELWERQLWALHVNLSLSIEQRQGGLLPMFGGGGGGGGGSLHSAQHPRRRRQQQEKPLSPPFLDGEEKLRIFHAIVEAERGRTRPMSESGGESGRQLQQQQPQPVARREKRSKTAAAKSTSSLGDNEESDTTTTTKHLWPLCLPAMQHALIASMVLSSPSPFHDDTMMEDIDDDASPVELLFLCNSFLNSMEDHVSHLSSSQLPKSTRSTAGMATSSAGIPDGTSSLLTVTDNALLSLRDARLFAVAMSKLQRSDQKNMLERFINISYNGLASHQDATTSTPSLEAMVATTPESRTGSGSSDASHFFARAITLCSALVDIASSPDLCTLLNTALESTGYSIQRLKPRSPSTTTTTTTGPTTNNQDSIFTKEIYQGLFTDWQSPSVPAANITSTEMILHENTTYKKLESLLHCAITVGFTVAKYDGCHLLFSSWNAAAKLPSWTPTSSWDLQGGPAAASVVKKLDCTDRLLRLREDMYEVYRLMATTGNNSSLRQQQQQQPETLLMKAVSSKVSHTGPNEALLGGLNSAEKLLANCTVEISGKKKKSSVPTTPTSSLATFAYYEALPLYLSFLISLHVRPGSNDMGSIHRLHQTAASSTSQKASSASSSQQRRMPAATTNAAAIMYQHFSDDDTVDGLEPSECVSIVRRNALTRLHEACLALGTAPCHPDWLDTNCRLQTDIIPHVAVDSADRALSALTNFGVGVLKCYFGAFQQALGCVLDGDSMQEDKNPTSKTLSVALQLFFAQSPCELTESFYSQVASLCQIDSTILKLVIHSLSDQQNLGGNALLATSAQRIKGADYHHNLVSKDTSSSWKEMVPGEHRANCQWETLLGACLQGSSLAVDSPLIDSAVAVGNGTLSDSDLKKKIADAVVSVNHWRRILYSVINAMVPTTALIRFGVYDGKGRSTHPLCEDRLPGSIFSSSSDSNHEGSSTSFSTKNEVGTTIKKALSFLSCVSAYSSHDGDMRLASRMAAGHLLENSSQFNDLISLWMVRMSIEAIDGVVQIQASEDNKLPGKLQQQQSSSTRAIIETTLKQQFADTSCSDDEIDVETGLPIITLEDALDDDKRNTLLSCLGIKNLRVGRLIGNSADLELTSGLLAICGEVDPFISSGGGSWGLTMGRDITKLMLTLMCGGGALQLHIRARIFVAEMLTDLMDAEFEIFKGKKKKASPSPSPGGRTSSEIVRLSAAVSLDELSKADVLFLVENIVPSSSLSSATATELESGDDLAKRLSQASAKVISYLAIVSHKGVAGVSGDGSLKIILHEMLRCLDKWASSSSHHVINLLCLLASRFGVLNDVGKSIVSLLQPTGENGVAQGYVDTAKNYFEFIASLDDLVNQRSSPSITHATTTTLSSRAESSLNQGGTSVTLKNGEEVPRTCSFVETGEGFTEQHWYNCYTCGLLWDKGCCSLCARVCHKGHDIGYSRKSSFFCDCGAEVATALEQNRTPCQCLSPVAEETIRELYEDESEADESESTTQTHGVSDVIFTELIANIFPSECKGSLQTLVEEAKSSQWRESILLLFNKCYQTKPSPGAPDFSTLFSGTAPQPIAGGSPNIELRSAKPLTLKHLNEASMLPIRAAKASALQSRMISSSSTSHISRKARSDLTVQAIAADNRGRLFIAESSSVLFCNAIPSVNVCNMENSPATHLSRSQLNILGSDSVKFPINGMALCCENNRHLLVWGVSKACVAIISKGFNSFERIIELKLNLDSSECESEYLVKCDWMPQSELQIVAVCGTVVHMFDLKRTEDNSCNATTHYALAYEDVLIRSATLIGSLAVDDCSAIETKLALLLDTGRLYFISLTIDEDGNLEDHGESYIEIGAGISFPSSGIRRYCGGDPVPKGTTATTFGEGVYLAYLRQSNLLLYQCVSSCCIAMLLDDDGLICGSFELLPNMISADDIGGHYGVAGPYTQFQELGIVRRGEGTFYRVTCVGRSTRSTQPRALIVEFNEHSVSVKELAWPTNCSSGLGFISSYNFVGSCTFSVPYIANAAEGNEETKVYERAFLTLMSSSGSLLWYGEECEPKALSTHMPYYGHHVAPDIGVFEKMINVSELEGLVFGGDFVGKDEKAIKRKLSLNNTDYVISPSRDGCTLTAGFSTIGIASKSITDRKSGVEDNALAIVAVRVLVGSMPDLIPREIAVMGSGRTIKLKKNVKRWYDFPLTSDETLLAIRNGFVTIWISPCHDSSSTPIIDSVEVYARARSELAFLRSDLDGGSREELPKLAQSYCVQEQPSSDRLVPCIRMLQSLTQICQNKMGMSAGSRDTVSRIIQQTALDSGEKGTLRDQTIEFLSEAEADATKRTYLIDNATLRGLMSALQGLGKFLRTEFASVDLVSPEQEPMINCAIDMLLHILSLTISIVRTRGGNYRKVVTEMIAEKACQVSMALEGKKVLDYCQYLKTLHGANLKLSQPARLVSEIILMEIACSDSKDFAQFDTLAEYLVVDSAEIAKACCSAISSAIGGAEGNKISSSSTSPEKELAYITYQCDACLVFPITERRYTLGGDEMDIDLCKQCYDLGIAYARTHDQNDHVIINGRTLCVEDEDMTCGKIWQMTSKPIAASSLEQAEHAKREALNLPLRSSAKDTGLKLSTEGQILSSEISGSKQGDHIEVVKTEGFRSQIFTQLLGLMTKSLDAATGEETSPPSSYVLQLVIGLVLDSCTEELKSARGKEMALAFTKNIPSLVKACQANESSSLWKLVVSLRALASLVLQTRETNRGPALVAASEEDTEGARTHHHKDKTDPRFICQVHGVPAVRRRCSHGVHKDRRFYVCGLERKHRCNYFKWSSDIPESGLDANGKDENQIVGRDDAHDIFVPVLQNLQQIFSENNLQEQFCKLVSCQFEKNLQASAAPEVSLANEGSTVTFPSLKSEVEKTQDMNDGVFRTLEKLGKSKPIERFGLDEDDSLSSSAVADGTKDSFLCSSLDLFSLLPMKRNSTSGVSSAWSPVLCEIISTSTSHVLRHLAKSMLQRLCGGRQEIYHRVRDHYVFGFQFRKLLQRSQDILDSALVVREQARQCGSDWREEEVMFESLPASGLLGVEDLISEDCYAISTEESIATVLDELLSAAGRGVGVNTKARSNNWRQFCGLSEMVISSRKGSSASADTHAAILEMLDQIYHRPPIVALLWLSSCLRGSNQVKALSLADIALEDLNGSTVQFQGETVQHNDDDEGDLLVGGYYPSLSDPEECLLKCFTIDDLISFIKQFVLNGRSKDLRSVSSNVARKLALQFPPPDKNRLFACLIGGPFQEVGTLGNASNNFSDLLRIFVESFGSELDLSNVSSCIATSFINQMTNLNQNYQGLFGKNEADSGGLNWDLSNCVHCKKQIPPKKATKSGNKKSDNPSQSAVSKDGDACVLPDQVRPYQRGRLETSTAASVSSEFSTYNQLKFRVALSQVHVTVGDPRGRLVKTIGVYFSPRQVSDVNALKSAKYNHLWQRCGSLSLARGATEATCKLKTPVIAANLKFTYEEFFEKASSKRAPDGSFILYCPRCTRQVNNAHGVCGNCGEVAFQCRKCRHINYDRLDAFLCVECGYCTAGGFSYELTAGIALNAIAILDEDGFQRSMAMLRIASKRQADLGNSLKKKVTAALQQQRKLRGDQIENLEEMVLYGPHLKRALLGGMPKSEGFDDDDDSNKKPSGSSRARGSSSSLGERAATTSSRARSLLSLARSLRAEGGDSFGSRGDFLRQALLSASNSGPSGSGFDSLDDTDLLSALSAPGAASSSSDPLSRIVANIHARAREEGRSSRSGASGAGGSSGGGRSATGASRKDDKSKLSPSEERHRLFTQMREAERECYELNRRIDAWNLLNKDCLAGFSSPNPFTAKPFVFMPSNCSACSMQVTCQILSLLHAVYIGNISQSEHTVSSQLIKILLKESATLTPRLNDLKRSVIITLASTSERASKIILAELQSRLEDLIGSTVRFQGETVQHHSAQILGKLVQLDFPSVDAYIELAMAVLANMQ